MMALAAFYATKISTEGKLALVSVPRDAFVSRWGVFADEPDKTMPICVWDAVLNRNDPDDKRRTNLLMRSLAYLVECPWCSGFWWAWVAALAVPVPGVPLALVALGLAGAVGVLSECTATVAAVSTHLQTLDKK